jgi:hypothetical protein
MFRCNKEKRIHALTSWFNARWAELILYKTYIFAPVFVKWPALVRRGMNIIVGASNDSNEADHDYEGKAPFVCTRVGGGCRHSGDG